MKKLIMGLAAAVGMVALAGYEIVTVPTAPASIEGKVVAVDVASTNATAQVAMKRIRNVKAWTNGIEVVTATWTNSVSVFNHSNNTWVATNIIHTAVTTNRVKLLSLDKWVTNKVIDIECKDNFATSNIVDGAWFVGGDFIFADGHEGDAVKVVVEK